VLKDGDYVCFESSRSVLPGPEVPAAADLWPYAGEAGTIMRVICEYQAYIEPRLNSISTGFSAARRSVR